MVGLQNKAELGTRALMELEVAVGAPTDLGTLHGEGGRLILITGGVVKGGFEGRILPGGADWQAILPDGTLEIRARYVAELAQGLVEIRSDGIRHAERAVLDRLAAGENVDASDYYFRTAIRFRTAAEPLLRLNNILAIAVGERLRQSVHLRVFEIL
jgi:hypothetical protein